jgi:acyl carrier protein
MNTILEKVFVIVNDIAEENGKKSLGKDEISPDLDLRQDFLLDSLDLAELTVRIEDEFDIDVFEDGLVSKIAEIVAKIEN